MASSPGTTKTAVFDATQLQDPVNLSSTWLMHAGDDPAYAKTDFDDSSWIPFDPDKSLLEILPGSKPEIVWYRQRIRVSPSQSAFGLIENNLASSFEIFANGTRVFRLGQVSPPKPGNSEATVLVPIDNSVVVDGSLLIALRVHISPWDWTDDHPGFTSPNLIFGRLKEVEAKRFVNLTRKNAPNLLIQTFGFCTAALALMLFAAQRRQSEYLWIFLTITAEFLRAPIEIARSSNDISFTWYLLDALLFGFRSIALTAVFFAFMGRRMGIKLWTYVVVSALLSISPVIGQFLGHFPLVLASFAHAPYAILTALIMIWLLVQWRRGDREAAILLVPAILDFIYEFALLALRFVSLIPAKRAESLYVTFLRATSFMIGPFPVTLFDLVNMMIVLSLSVIMLRRSLQVSRQQAVFEGEVAAAREVQQIIVPEHIDAIDGFSIETAYLPAQQVGGDFFQILPAPDDGMLVVVGDVAGKGLPAAMLVSVLVGATRTAAMYSQRPEEILAQLNERLVGRARGGFSTALAAHISQEGVATIANAGHLSPYLDGREMELPGALPLGILSGATYETVRFSIPHGSRLTFYSDGVIEAQKTNGELLGFDFGRELSTQSATYIADTAKAFGQSDDITVVAIIRDHAPSRLQASSPKTRSQPA